MSTKTIYNNLPPIEKLEVVRKWVEYLIDRYPNKPLYRCIASFYNDQRPILMKDTFDLAKENCNKCYYCGTTFTEEHKLALGHQSIITKDHFIPRSKIKRSEIRSNSNSMILCCITCNKKKSNMNPSEFIHYLRSEYEQGRNFQNMTIDNVEEMIVRLQGVIHDIHSGRNRRYYYLT